MSKQKNQDGFTVPHILMFLLVLGFIGGTGYYVYSQQDNKTPVTSQSSQEQSQKEDMIPTDLSGLKTADEIKQIAEKDAGTVTVISVELEQEDGGLVYKVKLSDGKILYFDAKTGASMTKDQVKDDGPESENDDDGAIPVGFVAGITIDQARKIAQDKYPSKEIEKIKLEVEDGVVVYSVRFTDDSRVDVDAKDGDIERARDRTTDEDDSDDDSDEDHNSGSGSDDDDSDDDSDDD